MGEDVYMALAWVSLFAPLLPLSALIIKGKSASELVWRTLFVFLVVSFACDYGGRALGLSGITNMPVIHVYNFLIGSIIFYYYSRTLHLTKMKSSVSWLFFLFLFVSVVEFFYAQGYLSYNTFSQFVLYIIALFFAMLWFYQVFFSKEQFKLTAMPEFWVNVGFFFYFGTTMVLTLFSQMILYTGGDHALTMKLWPIQLVTNISFNLIILRAVWAMKRA